jgi:hypothetical protein
MAEAVESIHEDTKQIKAELQYFARSLLSDL